MAVRKQLPDLERVVVIDTRGVDMTDPLLMSLTELEALGASSPLDVAASAAAIDPESAAIIVYTSGTPGPPQGTMHSHRTLQPAAATSGPVSDVTELPEARATPP